MDTFNEVGERAMMALVTAIRDELVSRQQVHVKALGTFRIVEEPASCTQDVDRAILKPPSRQIVFEAERPDEEADG